DLNNRMRGSISDVKSRMSGGTVPDRVLEARVRSRIGRVVSHPRALRITARDGSLHMSGPVLTHEVNDLLRIASSVPGVQELTHQLDIHEQADIPSLQGGRQRPGYPGAFTRDHWKPATRLIVGAGGAFLGLYSLRHRGLVGLFMRAAGGTLLVRAGVNEKLRRLAGMDGSTDLIEVQKTVHLDAPVRAVFSFWDRVENFPHFMRNVRDVVDHGGGRSHWTVAGPAGTEVSWDAEVVERIENQLLAWRTSDSSTVHHAGIVRFTEEGEERTRVDIRLSYTPPGGALGHVVATMFGSDPKHELDGDLARMKTMIETGRLPHDAARRDGTTYMTSDLPTQRM
ncbi:MAG TPA: SRPBCC family protein, partial [Rhodothermales bacterium]